MPEKLKAEILARLKARFALHKVVIDTPEVKITDYGDGTSGIYLKKENELITVSNEFMRQIVAKVISPKSLRNTAVSHLN